MKKLMFLLIMPVILCFQQSETKRVVIVAYREPEMMYGNIKQVIELRPDKELKGDIPLLCPFDTTNFDTKEDPVETKLGVKNGRCMLISYITNYDNQGNRISTTVSDGDNLIYKYDSSGYIIKAEHYTTSMQLLYYDVYKYDSAGDIAESDHYHGPYEANQATKSIRTKIECDLNGFLLSAGGLTYKYLLIDSKGNWTKRIIIGQNQEIDTIIRKITYY